METIDTFPIVITPQELLDYWQGHRRLTRGVIEAFPEDKLFSYSIGGMRPFSAIVLEMNPMAGPGPGHHRKYPLQPGSKKDLLQYWDEVTGLIALTWPMIAPESYHEIEWMIDNEVNHRAQGNVYLRSLGIGTPAFCGRS